MKKFTNNDIFYNTLLTNPKYTIVMQSGSSRINDQINQNQEQSSSISGVEFTGSFKQFKTFGSYEYSASINREYIRRISNDRFDERYTYYSSLKKIATLNSILHNYRLENEYANMDYYLKKNLNYNNYSPVASSSFYNSALSPTNNPDYFIRPTCSLNLLEIPRDFYGDYIKPGSVKLNMYISGNLVASAEDADKTGKIYQTFGSGSGGVIGSIFYDHGIILLTGSEALSLEEDNYIQPTSSAGFAISGFLKWIYFGSYNSTVGSAPSAKYELIFEGTNFVPTLTMMCHAEKEEFFWSNNRTFIEAGQGEDLILGQTSSIPAYTPASGTLLISSNKDYIENQALLIKNTVSSSFAHYSASYQPQVFISEIGIYDEEKNLIGIAKLANPVRKTKEMEYTFKLKLDM